MIKYELVPCLSIYELEKGLKDFYGVGIIEEIGDLRVFLFHDRYYDDVYVDYYIDEFLDEDNDWKGKMHCILENHIIDFLRGIFPTHNKVLIDLSL
jgi:hypothetical protein